MSGPFNVYGGPPGPPGTNPEGTPKMATYSATRGDGARWAADARAANLRATATGGSVIALTGKFPPGDADAYTRMESKMLGHLRAAPITGAGSTWGDTSNGVGGAIALERGTMTIKVSGVSKRFASGI